MPIVINWTLLSMKDFSISVCHWIDRKLHVKYYLLIDRLFNLFVTVNAQLNRSKSLNYVN